MFPKTGKNFHKNFNKKLKNQRNLRQQQRNL